MSADQFLHCRDCDVVFRPTPYDRVPEYRMTADGYEETPRDDCMAFLAAHARHALRTLRATDPTMVREGPLWDPMVATFWQVSDGDDTVVVQGWRDQIGDAMSYRVVPGRIVAERIAVEIPEEEIREHVDRALFPGIAPDRKLTAFIEAFKTLVWELDPRMLEILHDVPSDPTLHVARLPAWALERLTARARGIFDAEEHRRLAPFLDARGDAWETLTVLVRECFRVEA